MQRAKTLTNLCVPLIDSYRSIQRLNSNSICSTASSADIGFTLKDLVFTILEVSSSASSFLNSNELNSGYLNDPELFFLERIIQGH